MLGRSTEVTEAVRAEAETQRTPGWARRLAFLWTAAVLTLSSCQKPEVEIQPAAPAPQEASLQPAEILQNMLNAYRTAASYRDVGAVVLQYRLGGQDYRDEAPLSVAAAKPNQLAVQAYQLRLACDGEHIRAMVQDEASQNMDGQFVSRPAPQDLTLTDLYQDEVLREVISSGLGRHPVQLELLYGEDPLQAFVKPDTPHSLVESQPIEGHACWGVEVVAEEGAFVLWIDQESYILRRMDYPTERLAAEISPSAPIPNLKLAAEFRDAEFGVPPSTDQLELAEPNGAKVVRYFVLPPQPLPSDLFGKPLNDFYFDSIDGNKITRQDLLEKIAVLFWVVDDANCREITRELEKVQEQFQDSASVQFIAVCTQPSSVSNEQLKQMMSDWGSTATAVRDLQSFGRDVFHIPGAPTLIVLNDKGVAQIIEAGFNPNVSAELPIIIQRLQAGDDLSQEILDNHRQEVDAYAAELTAAQDPDSNAFPAPNVTRVAAARDPEHLKLTEHWRNDTLTAPGNLLVLQDGDEPPRISIIDGERTVVDLDLEGQERGRRELPLPKEAKISYLRSSVDQDGRRFYLASHFGAPQFHVFDDHWRLLFSYPETGQRHDGIRDVQLADLDSDGELEIYVGFAGIAGVHCVDMEGTRLWGNRSVADLLTLAPTLPSESAKPGILLGSEKGIAMHIDTLGQPKDADAAPGRAMFHLYSAPRRTAPSTPYCGFTYSPRRRLTALGLNPLLREVWSYELPAGMFQEPIQFVTSGRLLGEEHAQWILAAPNSTVHVISGDGKFFDHFGWGESLTGLGVARWDDSGLLFAASKSKLTAWRVELTGT